RADRRRGARGGRQRQAGAPGRTGRAASLGDHRLRRVQDGLAPGGRVGVRRVRKRPFGRNGNATLRTGFSQHLGRYHPLMPPYKEQGIVLRSMKLGEADKIVSILTQGSGKVRGVAKGIRKTTSRFGGRLEPFTHVNLMLYRGRGALDTITQAEIIAPHRNIRDDLSLFAAAVSPDVLALLAHLATADLTNAGRVLDVDERTRRRSRSLLFGFVEYHLERRMKSVPMLVRTAL